MYLLAHPRGPAPLGWSSSTLTSSNDAYQGTACALSGIVSKFTLLFQVPVYAPIDPSRTQTSTPYAFERRVMAYVHLSARLVLNGRSTSSPLPLQQPATPTHSDIGEVVVFSQIQIQLLKAFQSKSSPVPSKSRGGASETSDLVAVNAIKQQLETCFREATLHVLAHSASWGTDDWVLESVSAISECVPFVCMVLSQVSLLSSPPRKHGVPAKGKTREPRLIGWVEFVTVVQSFIKYWKDLSIDRRRAVTEQFRASTKLSKKDFVHELHGDVTTGESVSELALLYRVLHPKIVFARVRALKSDIAHAQWYS